MQTETAAPREEPQRAHDAGPAVAVEGYDCVDDCGDASFPASDPPGWWSGQSA